MKKYNLKGFGFYARFIPPFTDSVVRVWKNLIKNSYRILRKSKDVEYKKYDLGGFYGVLIKPKNAVNVPCIIDFHGGAFVFPAHVSHYKTAVNYVETLGVAVFLVNYRTAPENPYPAQESDCKKAFDFVIDNAKELSVCVDKLALAGDSAGGNLALKVSRYAKQTGRIIKCQAFFYPVTDPDIQTQSKREFTDTPMWNSRLNEKMWKYYFNGKTYKEVSYDKIFSDFDLSVAPAFIEVCEYDCLRDEGLLLYDYFSKNKVESEKNVVYNAMHGYEIKDNAVTRDAFIKRTEFFKKHLL